MKIRTNRLKTSLKLFLVSIVFSLSCRADNSASQVLKRMIGEDNASRFELKKAKSSSEGDWFEIKVKNDKICIKGSSPVALSKGAYAFITDNNYGVITWEGTNVTIPEELEDRKYDRVNCSMPLRMYINPCTYGYTMAWWDWERWEKELDWMALHGINMPLALLGQEIVWKEVWLEMGIDEAKLDEYFCGPAFLPWFRMGNIYDHVGPLPKAWMDKEKELQKTIMQRMNELGMRPIVPAFSGHVPAAFSELYPEAKTYELRDWGGLEPEKASHLLDPNDPLFAEIGKNFLKKYENTYGKADLFLADSFNEMLPPVTEESKSAELAEYGESIYKAIQEHNPEAKWVVQGWTFGHLAHFWDSESTQAFFRKIPKDNLLMLNYGEDRYSIWEKLDAFYGFPWTYGYVHNYGGQQSLFGDLNLYHDRYVELMANENKGNLVGYGCLPEAIENNSIVYDYIFDVPWGGTELSVTDWVERYIANRYGKLTSNSSAAWKIALENTYSVKEWKTNHLGYGTYIHNNRPSLDNHIGLLHGNPETVSQVLRLLLDDYQDHKDSDLYFYDVVDFAQHYTAYLADSHLVKASEHYKELQFEAGDREFEETKRYLKTLEVLQVATGGSFTQWCEDAVSHATTEAEKALYLRNAKTQITIWGGNRLKDYASKSWSGILNEFYVPRWQMLFDEIKEKGEDFDESLAQEKIIKMEEEWTMKQSIPESPEILSKNEYIELVYEIIN